VTDKKFTLLVWGIWFSIPVIFLAWDHYSGVSADRERTRQIGRNLLIQSINDCSNRGGHFEEIDDVDRCVLD
jgi:hypothetical protein